MQQKTRLFLWSYCKSHPGYITNADVIVSGSQSKTTEIMKLCNHVCWNGMELMIALPNDVMTHAKWCLCRAISMQF